MDNYKIDKALVVRLIGEQFPQFKNLTIEKIEPGGWDHKMFRLGQKMVIRLPKSKEYAVQVKKEQIWLPFLKPFLPLLIPTPLEEGKPTEFYPYPWSIYSWIEGTSIDGLNASEHKQLAVDLGGFLSHLQKVNTNGAPHPGTHNFYRGGSLEVYHHQTIEAISLLEGKIDTSLARKIWEEALSSSWLSDDVWIHGDIAPSNLLIEGGRLKAVLDFGLMAVGDPACDLTIAWTLFSGESRQIFKENLSLDNDVWKRAKGWTLWKYLIVLAKVTKSNAFEEKNAPKVISALLSDLLSEE